MKISRKQLRRIILEQDAGVTFEPDSDEVKQLKTAMDVKSADDNEGSIDSEEAQEVLDDNGVSKDVPPEAAMSAIGYVPLKSGGYINPDQLPPGSAVATESKMTRSGLRKLIIQELAKLPIYKKYSYGIDDIPDAGKAEDDIIGHT